MEFQQVGCIHRIGQIVRVTPNFRRRELVIDCSEYNRHTGITYPNYPVFEAVQAKANHIDDIGLEVGERVIITFEVRGRESKNGAYYNSLRILSIDRYPMSGDGR